MTHDLYLGDWLRIMKALAPDERASGLVAASLGLPRSEPRAGARRKVTVRAAAKPAALAAPPEELPLRLRVEQQEPLEAGRRPAWLDKGELLPREAPLSEVEEGRLEPLLSPRTAAHVGEAIAATRSAEGDPWMERIVEALASWKWLSHLPRRWKWTLRRGVQVEVDVGVGMIPYDLDVEQLLALLRSRVGSFRVVARRFRGTPLADRWSPPRNGEPILIVSDFGVAAPHLEAAPADPLAWTAFLAVAGTMGGSVVALSPFPKGRAPAAVARRIPWLHWDRTLTVLQVRRELRRLRR